MNAIMARRLFANTVLNFAVILPMFIRCVKVRPVFPMRPQQGIGHAAVHRDRIIHHELIHSGGKGRDSSRHEHKREDLQDLFLTMGEVGRSPIKSL